MTRHDARKKLFQSLGACFLAFVMILTNVLGAVEVQAASIAAPTIDPVSIGATEVSGKGLIKKGQRSQKKAVCNIIVTVKDADGVVKETQTFSIQPTEKDPKDSAWSVTLTNPVLEGYKVYAKQELVGKATETSEEVSVDVKKLLAPQYENKLKMPELEVWSEDTNVLEADAVKDIVDAFKKENNKLENIDGKNFEGNLTGIDVAGNGKSLTVTFSDGSKIENIDISDKVTVNKITEVSTAPIMNTLKVTDGTISGKMDLTKVATPERLKVEIVTNFGETKPKDFCTENGCSIDKGTKAFATVNPKTGEFSYEIGNNNVKLGKDFGVIVKEYRKKNNCGTIQPVTVIPKKTDVKDPKKLTDKDKEAIEKAIREANTIKGESKLPDGTAIGLSGIPAIIDFDKDGNVKIISPNDIEVDGWDSSSGVRKPVFAKNPDGTYKLKPNAKVYEMAAKDLVKNIKPEKPVLALSGDKKSITITPNKVDTDANSISVSYTGKDGSTKTTTATKGDNGWTIEGDGAVDANGVITIPKNVVKSGTEVTATVTDKGGIAEGDTDQLTSDPGSLELKQTKAEQVTELGGLDPVDLKKWVGDELNWKDGVKAKDPVTAENKTKIDALLAEAGTTFVDATRNTSAEGDFEGKIKVTFDDGSSLEVENQNLYVNNHVTSIERKDKVPADALDVEFKLGEGTKVDNVGTGAIEGKTEPVSYANYKVKPNTNLKEYKLPTLNTSVVDSIKLTAQNGYTEPVWRDSQNGTNFVATADNNVFTATATKTFKVTVKPNGGTGDEKVETIKKDGTYKLPAANTFTPPNENQEFSGWKIGDDTNLKQPETEITITSDTEINAIWKPIEFKVDFKAGEGASGSMEDKTVTKGSEYELPDPTFTAPKDKVFAGWKVGNQDGVKQAGETIKISGNVTLTATWKDNTVDITFDGAGGSGSMEKASVAKGSEYTLPENGFTAPENKKFDGWMVGTEKKSVGEKITVNDNMTVKAIWKDIEYKVTFNGNTGTGTMPEKSVKKGNEYELPANGFTAPENKQFDGWMVGTEKKSVGDKIVINADTEVKAIWKDIEYKVTFDKNGGEGSMDAKTVKKGERFKLPPNGFTAPKGKEFAGWQIGQAPNKVFAPETMVEVNGDTVVKAIWQDVPSKPDAPRWNDSPGFVFPRSEGKEMETGRHYRYLYGYEDKSVRPEGNITRAEAAALIARLAGLDMSDESKPNFADTPSRWYNSAINIMVKMDLMFADKDGNFRPNEPITRAEFARALYYVDKKNDTVAPFADVKGHVYEDAINQAYGNGRISGYPDGTFRPDAKIQRAEVARILNQYANRGTTLEGMAGVAKDLIQFTDINPGHWAYCEVMEAANNHEYEREKGTQSETWLRILPLDLKIAK